MNQRIIVLHARKALFQARGKNGSPRIPSGLLPFTCSNFYSAQSHYPCQKNQIPDFEITILIEEDIARLKITMDDACGMNIFESPKHLIEEVLNVFDFKLLFRLNHAV
jgi:hypothetical protein